MGGNFDITRPSPFMPLDIIKKVCGFDLYLFSTWFTGFPNSEIPFQGLESK
jgi:hypothetical protein